MRKILFLGFVLCLFNQGIAQRFHLEVKLTSVWAGDVKDNSGNKADPIWKVSSSLSNGPKKGNTEYIYKSGIGTFLESRTLLNYNETSHNKTIDLCNGPNLSIRMDAWEDDGCGNRNSYDGSCPGNCCLYGDDDYAWNSKTFDIWKEFKGKTPGASTSKSFTVSAGKFSISGKIYLKEVNALQNVVKIENSSGADQAIFCNGDSYQVVAALNSGYKGGKFQWQQNNGSGWFDINSTSNKLTPFISNNRMSDFRVRLSSANDCMVESADWISSESQTDNITVGARPPSIQIRTTATCSGSNNGRITLKPRTFSSSDNFEFTLVNSSNVPIRNETNIVSNREYVIDNLPAGVYNLKTTNKTIEDKDGNEEQLAACTSVSEDITVRAITLPTFEVENRDAKCFGGDGEIAFSNIKNNVGTPSVFITDEDGKSSTKSSFSPVKLKAGTYKIKIRTRDNCDSEEKTVTIGQPQRALSIIGLRTVQNSDGFQIRCFNGGGTIDMEIAGGTPPYRVFRSPNFNLGVADIDGGVFTGTGLPSGNHTIIVRDKNNCQVTESISLNAPPPVVLNVITTEDSRSCDNDGSLEVSASGGLGDYQYKIEGETNFQNSGVFQNLAPGGKRVVVKDKNNCERFKIVTISQQSEVVLNTSSTSTTCSETADGKIEVTVNDGTPPYMVSVEGRTGSEITAMENETVTFDNFLKGEYAIKVIDNSGCQKVKDVTVFGPSPVEITYIGTTPIRCEGDSAILRIEMDGVDGGFSNPDSVSISFDGGNTFPEFYQKRRVRGFFVEVKIPADSYSDIQVKTTKDCISNIRPEEYRIDAPEALKIMVTEVVDESCVGAKDGSITIKVTGGRAPYSISLFKRLQIFGGEQDHDPLAERVEDLFPDVNTDTATYTFTGLEPLFVDDDPTSRQRGYGIHVTDQVITQFDNDYFCLKKLPTDFLRRGGGFALIPPLEKPQLLPGRNSFTEDYESNLIMVYGATQIRLQLDSIVYGPEEGVRCKGDNGEFSILPGAISGGLPPYEFSIDNQLSYQSSTDFFGTGQSSFLWIRDKNGCTINYFLENPIRKFNDLALDWSILQPALPETCEDNKGKIGLEFSGGILPYSLNLDFQNDGKEVLDTLLETRQALEIGGFDEGSFFISLIDNDGCITQIEGESIPAANDDLSLQVANTENESCVPGNDGKVNLAVIGGTAPYTLQKNFEDDKILEDASNQLTFDGLTSNRFLFTVKDQRGCFSNIDTVINAQADQLALDFNSVDVTTCPGDTTGGFSITPLNGVAPYTVISYPYRLGLEPDTVILQDGDIFTKNNLPAFEFEFEVTDARGCVKYISTAIGGPAPIVSEDTLIQAVTCTEDLNGAIDLKIIGGTAPYNFVWSGPNGFTAVSEDLINIDTGTYNLMITDDNGCNQSLSFEVEQGEALQLSTATMDASCFGESDGSILPTVSGGQPNYTYSLDGVNFGDVDILNNLPAGAYNLTLKDNSNCSLLVSNLMVNEPVRIEPEIELSYTGNCKDLTLLAAVTGGTQPYTYVWDDEVNLNADELATNVAGIHSLEIIDAANCSQKTSIDVQFADTMYLDDVEILEPLCQNEGEILLMIEGGTPPYNYQWAHDMSLSSANPVDLAAGNYSYTVTDDLGCEWNASVALSDGAVLNFTETVVAPLCPNSNDGEIELAITGGTPPYNFNWDDENASTTAKISNLKPGEYNYTVTDDMGCKILGTINLSSQRPPLMYDVVKETPTCENGADGTLTLSTLNNFSFLWEDGSTDAIRTGLTAGQYPVTITDANGCEETPTIELMDGMEFDFSLGGPDTSICTEEVLFYDFESINFGFQWGGANSFASTSNKVFFDNSGQYWVEATNNEGCIGRDTINLNIAGEPLQALFIVASDVVKGEEVGVLEASFPIPANIEWFYSTDSLTFLRQEQDLHYFTFEEVGQVQLTMKASGNGCVDWITKVITVHETELTIPSPPPTQPDLLRFELSPNPNNGVFDVIVELSRAQTAILTILNIDGVAQTRRLLQGENLYQENFNSGFANGTYILLLQTPRQRKSILFNVFNG